jgi:hypothetical protein
MTKPRIGKLPPRYTFILNPHQGTRVSSCPKCKKLTYVRKFALLIHIEDFGLVTLGKSSRYCPKCELIVTHQAELEHELVGMFMDKKRAEVIGKPYVVIGTVDLRAWKQFMVVPGTLEQVLNASSDFKKVMDLEFDPGGWSFDPETPKKKR